MIPYAFLVLPVFVFTGLLLPVLGLYKKKITDEVALVAAFASFLLSIFSIPDVLEKGFIVIRMAGFAAPLGINLVLDAFSLFILVVVTFAGLASCMLSRRFIKRRVPEYYALMMLSLAGLSGVAMTADLFNMFVFLELSGITAYALTAYYRDNAAVEGAVKYLIVGGIGTSLFLLGTALMYAKTGTLSLAHIANVASVATTGLFSVALSLLFAGLMIKSAIVPFHSWKPDAVEAAPVPIAMLFTSASATVGAYAIFRLALTIFNLVDFYLIFAILGSFTMVLGAVMALMQKNVKRLIAYSSISQMGYVLIAFALGSLVAEGYVGALFHLLNLVIIDMLLFFSAGILVHHTNTGEMDEMGDLLNPKANPLLASSFLIGVLALTGIPLSNGFASKWLIYVAGLKANPLLAFLALITSVITLGYGFKAFDMMFLSGTGNGKRIKMSLMVKFIIVLLSSLCLLLGVFPQVGIGFAETVISTSFDLAKYVGVLVV